MAPRFFRIREGESTISVRTRATGLLARLAHDLEIASTAATGTATEDGGAWTAEAVVPIASLRVIGALKGGKVDESVLSAKDRADIDQKMRADVFVGVSAAEITGKAQGALRSAGEIEVSIGDAKRARFPLRQTHTEGEGGSITVSGRFELSMRALGLGEVKGPLNAFRVSDTLEILYNLIVDPA